ncbi:uncharacterized protein LOC129578651 [Sitodiplosis mosellana]|uniref:uncharacterized protein LOC129578651 n=1 Tax=Sitodiplosis mosellana TaxID=263140 RepID=UPI002444EA4C|nr:uncharacterized protein LOC129578651 [Sitodiplosis mosellana]
MDVSLDDYIRANKSVPQTNMSLDEYIHAKNIKHPAHSYNNHNNQHGQADAGPSKFDRYKYQDEDDEEMDEDGSVKEMPKLVPFVAKTMPPKKKPIHQRLGERGSICESIHTSQMKLYRSNQFKAKNSVQKRLGKGYVNPAIVERQRITLHALKSFAKDESNMLVSNDDQGQMLLNAFVKAININSNGITNGITNKFHFNNNNHGREAEPKYDMKIQKEISCLQGKELYYACPGAFVISNDGPGLRGMVKVPSHKTDISLNQRFA